MYYLSTMKKGDKVYYVKKSYGVHTIESIEDGDVLLSTEDIVHRSIPPKRLLFTTYLIRVFPIGYNSLEEYYSQI